LATALLRDPQSLVSKSKAGDRKINSVVVRLGITPISNVEPLTHPFSDR
jgi:hypothetical protein